MSEYKPAKLAFITQPSPGVFVLNLDDGKKFTRLEVARGQLSNIVVDGAAMLLRHSPAETPT